MTVNQLTANDFESPGGKVMKLRRPGLVFVMFKTQNCPHCVQFGPQFDQISRRELRVKFATVDVGRFRQITGMAQTTNTPIKAVPTFILYLNSAPFSRYNGRHDQNNILAFLNVMVDKAGTAAHSSNFVQRRTASNNPRQEQNNGIGMSLQELRQQRESESKFVTDGQIPYNAEYMAYLASN